MKKIETSKLILIISYVISIVLTSIVIVGTFMSFDVNNITTIAALAYAELGSANIFYFKKAGRENVIKIYNNLPQEAKEQIDINQMLSQQ